MEKITLTQAVIVEGKYDKIKLDGLLDCVIIPTHGFQIFADKGMRATIARLAQTCGIVVITDSDRAGFRIRGHLSGIVGKGAKLTHVYVPEILGKERRKQRPSAEGKLGVEGIDLQTLRAAFAKAGLLGQNPTPTDPITRLDLYEAGLSGSADSAALRRKLFAHLGLPGGISSTSSLPILNTMLTRQQFLQLARQLQGDQL